MSYGVAVTPDGKKLLGSVQAANSLAVFDTTKLEKLADIAVGRLPEDVAASARPLIVNSN